MEALLIIGALAAGAHYMNKQDDPVVDNTDTTATNLPVGDYYFDEGLNNLDWSKAGNFRVTSTENNVTWVMVTGE